MHVTQKVSTHFYLIPLINENCKTINRIQQQQQQTPISHFPD